MERLARPPFFYGWFVVVAGMLMQFHLAWPPNTIGIFMSDMELELGWSRAAISSVTLFSGIGYVIFNILGGWLTDRYGPRLPIVLGAVITAAAVAMISQVSSLAQLYGLYVVSGATGFVFPIAGSITQRWFRRRRGLALGIVMAGSPLGGLVYPILVNWVTASYGWRSGYLAIAAVVGSLFLLAAFLIVARPEKMGLQPYGSDTPAPAGETAKRQRTPIPGEPAWTLREAFTTMAFPLLMVNSLLTVIPQIMVSVHIIPFATSIGISRGTAAAALGIRNFVGIFGSVLVGGFADRVGWKRGLVALTAFGGLWMFWLVGTQSAWMLWVFVILSGISTVGRGPLISGLLGNYYGTRSLTMLIATNNITSTIGGALGPPIGGFIYQRTGSYFIAFLIGAVLWMVAAVLFAVMRAPRKKVPPSVAAPAGG